MTSYAITDFMNYVGSECTPRDVIHMWRDAFDVLYAEGQRGHPKMLAYGMHPILAHPFRRQPLEGLIDYVKSKPGVRITTRGEIADWVMTQYPDRDLSKFYSEAVASDRYYGLGIGTGGQEAIDEALKYRRRTIREVICDR